MSEISVNLVGINNSIPSYVELVAVSKTKPESDILDAYNAGHKIFGENRAQEMAEKHKNLPQDIQWHMIGHLQSNKVKYIAPFVHMIHSVDRMKLLWEINKKAKENDRTIDCLLQVHIANEKQKFGFDTEEITNIMREGLLDSNENVRVRGLMGMATFTEDLEQIRGEFQGLKTYYDFLKTEYFSDQDTFNVLSMGMSGDYTVAIEEGSNMVRIGSLIFGARK